MPASITEAVHEALPLQLPSLPRPRSLVDQLRREGRSAVTELRGAVPDVVRFGDEPDRFLQLGLPGLSSSHSGLHSAELRLRAEDLEVDWSRGHLNATFLQGPFQGEVHGAEYRFTYTGDDSSFILQNRQAAFRYDDSSLRFRGVLDPAHPAYGRADLWLEETARFSLASSRDDGLSFRTDLQSGSSHFSSLLSRDRSFGGLSYVSPDQQTAFSAIYQRLAPGNERFSFDLTSPRGGLQLENGVHDGRRYSTGRGNLNMRLVPELHLRASGSETNGSLGAGLGFELLTPNCKGLFEFRREPHHPWSLNLQFRGQW